MNIKNSSNHIDDSLNAPQAANPAVLDRSVEKRLPFFAQWFNRWKRDCQQQVLAWRRRDKGRSVSPVLRPETLQTEKH